MTRISCTIKPGQYGHLEEKRQTDYEIKCKIIMVLNLLDLNDFLLFKQDNCTLSLVAE